MGEKAGGGAGEGQVRWFWDCDERVLRLSTWWACSLRTPMQSDCYIHWPNQRWSDKRNPGEWDWGSHLWLKSGRVRIGAQLSWLPSHHAVMWLARSAVHHELGLGSTQERGNRDLICQFSWVFFLTKVLCTGQVAGIDQDWQLLGGSWL